MVNYYFIELSGTGKSTVCILNLAAVAANLKLKVQVL